MTSFLSAGAQCIFMEISRPCPTPAGHRPAPNWKPSNDTLRACTALEMRMLIRASHFSVIQEWSSFFQFFFLKLFSFFSSSSFPFFPSSSSPFKFFFLLLFCFHLFSGHKTISCSDFLLKPPTKHFKLSPSSCDSHLPHSPIPLQFYLARVGGFEVCFSNSCVFSPSGPQPLQTPHSTTLVQPDFMQKRTAVTQLQSQ